MKATALNLYDSDLRSPSQEYCEPWIYAYADGYPFTGKWLVFVSRDKVDDLWKRINKATKEGLLGMVSKVSTMYSEDIYDKAVICVYTKDWRDKEDVMRVRKELRGLGVDFKIPYKKDIDTLKRKSSSTYYV